MDAGLFGQWLKTDYCKPRGITHIVDNVIGTNINDNGHLDSIKTKDSGDLSADLFVDCTGFKSLLLEGVMKEPFISFEDKLLSDKAVAIRIPYKDRELEMETATNATTLSSGWSWNIPLWNRIGTGYVYSSKFLSPEDAEKELREYLINDRDVPHDREEIEAIPAWHIDIKAGIHERSWVNNVVAIGLANGFIEPLESTGLMLTHEALSVLVDSLEHRDARINMIDVEIFNARVRTKMNDFSGFISSHYAFCERDDTPYWKYVTEELTYTEQWKEKNNTWSYYSDVIEYLMINDDWNLPPHAGLPFIMAAFGFNPVTKHKLQLHFGHDITEEDEPWIASVKLDKDIKEAVKWLSDYADELPTHYEFLKEHIYTDE
jgi:tryptophan halogenase